MLSLNLLAFAVIRVCATHDLANISVSYDIGNGWDSWNIVVKDMEVLLKQEEYLDDIEICVAIVTLDTLVES